MAFKRKKAKYPLRRTKCIFFTKSGGQGDLSEPNLITSGILPRKIIIGLVETDHFNGQLNRNPFNFKHFNLSEIILRINGQTIPYETVQPNYDDNCFLEAYITLLQGTSKLMFEDAGLNIHPFRDYTKGYTLYGFDLTPDFSETPSFHLLKTGNASVTIRLKQAHSESITIVAYMEYDDFLELDETRKVFINNN